jgi:hypothetical protein
MYDDNDNETEWGEINEMKEEMMLNLSIAVFDKIQRYGEEIGDR